jgi:hypothetical protein
MSAETQIANPLRYSLMDMIGDVSHHLSRPIAEIGGTA